MFRFLQRIQLASKKPQAGVAVERGQGPAVVLIHGIAFDRPGFGHSERPRYRLWTPWVQAVLRCTVTALSARALLDGAVKQMSSTEPALVAA